MHFGFICAFTASKPSLLLAVKGEGGPEASEPPANPHSAGRLGASPAQEPPGETGTYPHDCARRGTPAIPAVVTVGTSGRMREGPGISPGRGLTALPKTGGPAGTLTPTDRGCDGAHPMMLLRLLTVHVRRLPRPSQECSTCGRRPYPSSTSGRTPVKAPH